MFFVILNKSQTGRIKRNQVELHTTLFYMPSKYELKVRMFLVVLKGSKTHDTKSIVNLILLITDHSNN